MPFSGTEAALREQAATLDGEGDRMDWQEKYFQKLNENIGDLKLGLQQLNQRIEGVSQLIEGVSQRIDGVYQRVDGVYQRIDSMNQRLDSLNQQLGHTNGWIITLVVTTILSVVGLATGLLPMR